jgi:lysine biosynthesis protein LysW
MRVISERQYAGWRTTKDIRKGDRKVAECPTCESNVVFSNRWEIGRRIECPECGEELEVISLRPPELDYVFDDDDWDEDE